MQATLAGTDADDEEETPKKKPEKAKKEKWPATIPAQVKRLRGILGELSRPTTAAALSKRFLKPDKKQVADLDDAVEELLETLVAVGQARVTDDGRFVAL